MVVILVIRMSEEKEVSYLTFPRGMTGRLNERKEERTSGGFVSAMWHDHECGETCVLW